MIEVEGLQKTYWSGGEPVEAVRQLSFTARPGTIFGLLGPNGAGKTTTLRIIATMLQPTAGSVRVAGYDVTQHPLEVRRQIGFLSAGTALYDRLTPRETLRYFGRLNGIASDTLEGRIAELVETLEMSDFADRLCGLLSSGQKQKTSIARALIHQPQVLIFDEPTAALDVLVARALLDRIASLRDASRTIVLSTHIMSEAERLCDEVAIVHEGSLRASGTVAELEEQTGTTNLEDAFFALIRGEEATGAA